MVCLTLEFFFSSLLRGKRKAQLQTTKHLLFCRIKISSPHHTYLLSDQNICKRA